MYGLIGKILAVPGQRDAVVQLLLDNTGDMPGCLSYVVALDPQGPSIGPVSVTVYDVPADATTSATLGGPAVTVTTGVPGQNASVTFTGNAGDGVAGVAPAGLDLNVPAAGE